MMNKTTLVFAGIGVLAVSVLAVSGYTLANNATSDRASHMSQSMGSDRMMKGGNFGLQGRHARRGNHDRQDNIGLYGKKGMSVMKKDANLRAAVESNDYDAFVTAWNANADKPAQATLPTAEQFAKMTERDQQHAPLRDAVASNDYDAFTATWNANTDKPVDVKLPTSEQFAKMVQRHQQRANQ